jgi:hypothetical protein
MIRGLFYLLVGLVVQPAYAHKCPYVSNKLTLLSLESDSTDDAALEAERERLTPATLEQIPPDQIQVWYGDGTDRTAFDGVAQ